jgi:hypothetical protein
MGFLWWSDKEKPSPSNIVLESNLEVLLTQGGFYRDSGSNLRIKKQFIEIPVNHDPLVWMPGVPNTGSMDPNFDEGHNNILIRGYVSIDRGIICGWLHDRWVTNRKEAANIVVMFDGIKTLIHRIVDVRYDSSGRYWTTKGDNNSSNDRYKWRDDHLWYLSIGTIY